MESRGFKIPKKLNDIMQESRKHMPKGQKYSFEDAWKYYLSTDENEELSIIDNEDYIVAHRAIDDAIYEAKLLYLLIKRFKFPLLPQKELFF